MIREQCVTWSLLAPLDALMKCKIFKKYQRIHRILFMGIIILFKWIKQFREGLVDWNDDVKPVRLSIYGVDEIIECVQSVGLSDYQIIVWMIANKLNLGKSTVQTTLNTSFELFVFAIEGAPDLPSTWWQTGPVGDKISVSFLVHGPPLLWEQRDWSNSGVLLAHLY